LLDWRRYCSGLSPARPISVRGHLHPKKIFTFSFILLCCFAPTHGTSHAAVVGVDGSIEHQTIEGFGGDMESHDGYVNDSGFWDLLFFELGVSAINLGGPYNGDYTTIGDQWKNERFPMAREARNHGVKTFVLITTPRPEWKDTGFLAGGTLLPEYYDDYASYMLGFIDFMQDNTDILADYILPFPEPNWTSETGDPDGPWPYCYMTPDTYRDFIKIAGPLFVGSPVNLSVPCGSRVPMSVSYANQILADSEAAAYVDSLVTNPYEWPYSTTPHSWQNLANLATTHNTTGTWVAEASHFADPGKGSQMPEAHPAGIYTAQWLHQAFAFGDVSHYYWITMLDFGQHRQYIRGLVRSDSFPPGEFTTNGLTKVGYAFRQFSRWVRPGAIRVEAISDDSHVMVSAYKHAVQQTATIVAINTATSAQEATFNLANLGIDATLAVYRTSANEDGVQVEPASLSGGSFTYSLPAESTTTFFAGTLNLPPFARATASVAGGTAPLSVIVDASSSFDPDGDQVTYGWTFGDSTDGSTAATASHTFNNAGTYTIRLTVADGRGETAADSLKLTVPATDGDVGVQTAIQQKCINAMNGYGALVAAKQGRSNSLCIERASRGQQSRLGVPPEQQTAQACLANDVRERVARKIDQLLKKEAAFCLREPEQYPNFAYTGSVVSAAAAQAASIGIVDDLFGDDLDAAVVLRSVDSAGSKCQKKVYMRTRRLFDALWRAARQGKRKVLRKSPNLGTIEELQVAVMDYLSTYAERTLTRASEKIHRDAGRGCTGAAIATDLGTLFPGRCSAADADLLATCAEAAARCRFCESLNAIDDMALGCDEFDNGAIDGSCI
jgi:O-glycosyl hydrolase